ncbi:MAG: class I SAM-dependent methyltransferase [Ilumatobacteraceae bacterium]
MDLSIRSNSTGEAEQNRAELFQLWGEVLTGRGDVSPTDAVIAELAAYFGISEEEARGRCSNSNALSRDGWNSGDRSTAAGIIDFWNLNGPVFGITMSHVRQLTEDHPPSSIELALGLRHLPVGAMLDFGAGPGTNAMFFARLGWKVTLAEVSTPMLQFAAWRAARRGITMAYIDSRTTELPAHSFDVITALEVMHIVPNVEQILRQLHVALRPGGLLIFNVYAPPRGPETYSYLYEACWPVLRQVRRNGYRRHQRIAHMYVYERVHRGAMATAVVDRLDAVRYNPYVTMVGDQVRRVRHHARALKQKPRNA